MRVMVLAIVAVGCGNQNASAPSAVVVHGSSAAPLPVPALAPSSVMRALYAAGVVHETLPLSIGIETSGGVSSVVLARGAALPAHFSNVFSTQADDQPSVEVHLVQGERPLVADDREIGRFQLLGIPPAPRGIPKIVVTVSVDTAGALTVSAIDKATGKSQMVELSSTGTPPLDRAAVANVLADAEAHRDPDQRQRELSDLELRLDNLVYAEQGLDRDAGSKVAPTLRQRWQQAIRDAQQVRAGGDDSKLAAAFDQLKRVSNDVAAALYARP